MATWMKAKLEEATDSKPVVLESASLSVATKNEWLERAKRQLKASAEHGYEYTKRIPMKYGENPIR